MNADQVNTAEPRADRATIGAAGLQGNGEGQYFRGSEAIRTITDDNAKYLAFDNYPWSKDPLFKGWMTAKSGEPRPPGEAVALLRRTYVYQKRIGVQIDLRAYISWLDSNPDHEPPRFGLLIAGLAVQAAASAQSHDGSPRPNDAEHWQAFLSPEQASFLQRPLTDIVRESGVLNRSVPTGLTAQLFPPGWPAQALQRSAVHEAPATRISQALSNSEDATAARFSALDLGEDKDPAASAVPAWMAAAPKQDLVVDCMAESQNGSAAGQVPYPEKFAQILAAISSGQPVPGIRKIPGTVVRDEGTSPFGKLAVPKKPWERHQSSDCSATVAAAAFRIDSTFPPSDDISDQQAPTAPEN